MIRQEARCPRLVEVPACFSRVLGDPAIKLVRLTIFLGGNPQLEDEPTVRMTHEEERCLVVKAQCQLRDMQESITQGIIDPPRQSQALKYCLLLREPHLHARNERRAASFPVRGNIECNY